jgi:hypothetical protein
MEYKADLIKDKTYQITKEYKGKQIKFNVVVANDESEIPGLVDFYMNSLENPLNINLTQNQNNVNLNEVLLQQQELISQLQAEINSIKQKIE